MREMLDRFLLSVSCRNHPEDLFCLCSGIAINVHRLKELAYELSVQSLPYEAYSDPYFPAKNNDFAEFVLFCNVINFCTFDPATRDKISLRAYNDEGAMIDYPGSEALAVAVRHAVDAGTISIDANFIASEKFSYSVFRQVFENITPCPQYMDKDNGEQRFHMLKGFARDTQLLYGGSFLNILKYSRNSACHSGYGLVHRLKRMSGYNGDLLGKRALLSAYMIHSRGILTEDTLLTMGDVAHLAPLADPHIFRMLFVKGILLVGSALERKIASGTIFNCAIKEDNLEILAMRRESIKAMIFLLRRINYLRGVSGLNLMTMPQLDNYLWRVSRSRADDRGYFYALTTDC